MNKRLMESIAFLVMLFLITLTIGVYIQRYDTLPEFDKINAFNWFLGAIVALNMIIYLGKALKRVLQRREFGNIICSLMPNVSFQPLVSAGGTGIVLALWLSLYFGMRPSFTGLSMIIVFSLVMFDSLAMYFTETGITEKGIIEGNYFIPWEDISSYSYDEAGNILIFNGKKKYLFLKRNGSIKLRYKNEDKGEIDQLLTHHLG